MNKKKWLSCGVMLVLLTINLTACKTNAVEQIIDTQTESVSEAIESSEVVEQELPESEVSESEGELEIALEEDEEEYTYTEMSCVMYASTTVNVRDMPFTSGNILGSLSYNQEVEVLGQCNETGWYQISYNESVGFVSDSYLVAEKQEDPESTNGNNGGNSNGGSSGSTGWNGDAAELSIAGRCNQLIIVSCTGGSNAIVSMHNSNGDGTWSQLFSVSGDVGRNGIGKTSEGDGRTPTGAYGFTTAFGNAANPGCALGYTQCDSSWFWVDDSNSAYYNQFVSTNNVVCDWNTAEDIYAAGSEYNYCLALNYNSSCTPGVGSAIFLHCGSGRGTSGCIMIPESYMLIVMQNVQPGCIIIIDYQNNIGNY